MTLQEKIYFLEEELSRNPDAHSDMKREVESAFIFDSEIWEDYYERFNPDNGYALKKFSIIDSKFIHDITALIPKGIVDNVPYFREHYEFVTPHEAGLFMEDYGQRMTIYMSFLGERFDKELFLHEKLMRNTSMFFNDLLDSGYAAVISSIRQGDYTYSGNDRIYRYIDEPVASLARFVRLPDGQVKFLYLIPELEDDILMVARMAIGEKLSIVYPDVRSRKMEQLTIEGY